MKNRGGEQNCKAAANKLRKIPRAPVERKRPLPRDWHAKQRSNASFETKHLPLAVFPELLSFAKRR
ncbi:MAG: hypothetical protein DME65_06820 [Verrucomicrobia bacterium]|nr:MAG: hypothetical protein DME65_06820 [Verrucomicrobiota bacterium]